MNKIDSLDKLAQNYDNLVSYPILGLYVKDRNYFIDNFMVIDEDYSVTICDRTSSKMLTINKSESTIKKFTNKITKMKNINKKIFSIGSFCLYKTQVAAID